MKLIKRFKQVRTGVVRPVEGSRIVDRLGQLVTMANWQDQLTISAVYEAPYQTWYQTSAGYIALDDVVLFPDIQLRLALATIQTVQVTQPRGFTSIRITGELGSYHRLNDRLAVVARAETVDGRYYETPAGELIHATDVHVIGQKMTFTFQPQHPNNIQVVTPSGAAVRDDCGNEVGHLSNATIVPVLAEATDLFGDHYYQLTDQQYVAKTDTVALTGTQGWSRTQTTTYYCLNAENINQNFWGMPNGCEPAALLEGLHFKRVVPELDYQNFIDQVPVAADYNPYHGFGGAPDDNVKGRFEAIFPDALVKWGRRYGQIRNVSGATISQLLDCLKRRNPVVAYVTVGFETPEMNVYHFGKALSNNHAVLLDGISGDLVHVSDPIDGAYWLPLFKFAMAYNARHWAVEIL